MLDHLNKHVIVSQADQDPLEKVGLPLMNGPKTQRAWQ